MENTADPTLSTLADRLKQQRKERQLTLEQLAQQSGVSRSMLSQIERGQANPTLAIACRIAEALGVSIEALVEQPWTRPSIQVLRGDDPASVYRDDGKCRVQTLSPLGETQRTELYCVTLRPGGSLNSAPHFRGTREMMTVHSGQVQVSAGSDSRVLSAGDAAHYAADQDHCISHLGEGEAVFYLVVCLPVAL